MWFLLFMISIHGKWSTFTIWRVYLWCVFFISRSSFVCAKLTAHRDMFTSCWMWCRFSVFFLFRVYFSLCIITIHQIITLRGTTVFHVILLYRFFLLLLLSSLFCCFFFFTLASNISYLIILMCLIVCLKVLHRAGTVQSDRYHVHRDLIFGGAARLFS